MVKKLTSQEAAEYIGVDEQKLRMSRMDFPPFIKEQNRVYYLLSELKEWMKRHGEKRNRKAK